MKDVQLGNKHENHSMKHILGRLKSHAFKSAEQNVNNVLQPLRHIVDAKYPRWI